MAMMDGTRGLDGVLVREVAALGGPLSCLVGDLVGDCDGVVSQAA